MLVFLHYHNNNIIKTNSGLQINRKENKRLLQKQVPSNKQKRKCVFISWKGKVIKEMAVIIIQSTESSTLYRRIEIQLYNTAKLSQAKPKNPIRFRVKEV